MSAPTLIDWTAVKKILRYLKGTAMLKLCFSGRELVLSAYCDSDWGSDPQDRKSTTGYLIFLGDSLISWASKKQSTVAMSTMEAEFLALTACTQEIIYLRTLLTELKLIQPGPTVIFQDNQACIQFANTGKITQRSKHIEMRQHFVLDQIRNGHIKLTNIPTSDMLADPLTKPTNAATLRNFLLQIRLTQHP
jgi:hypothetical protein